MSNQIKKVFGLILRFGLSFILLGWIFSKIDWQETWHVLQNANFYYIGLALGVFFIGNTVILLRWLFYIRALGLDVTVSKVVYYFFIGLFCNLFLPSAIGGDVIKTIGMCRETPHKARVVASVLLDRVSGFLGIVLVALVAFAFGYKLIGDMSLLISVGVLAVISAGVIFVLFSESLYGLAIRIFKIFPKIHKALSELHNDLMLLKNKRISMLGGIAFSFLSQILLSVVFFLIAKGLLQDIPLIYFMIFIPLLCVASTLPSIGGLGVRETGAVYLFGKIGIEAGIAASISLMSFVFMVIVGLMGGIAYVGSLSSGWIQRAQTDPALEQPQP